MHPHAITQDERACLYMQDTWLVTPDGGVPFSQVPIRIFDGRSEALIGVNGLDVFIEALPPSLQVDTGVRVEERGFRAAWFPEITFGDAFGAGDRRGDEDVAPRGSAPASSASGAARR